MAKACVPILALRIGGRTVTSGELWEELVPLKKKMKKSRDKTAILLVSTTVPSTRRRDTGPPPQAGE